MEVTRNKLVIGAVTLKKRSSCYGGRKICRGKIWAQNFFLANLRKFGKESFALPNICLHLHLCIGFWSKILSKL